jgi:hypothetical protein
MKPARQGSVHRFVPRGLRPASIAAGRGFRELQHRVMNRLVRVHERPIFVLGNQKSGTTAIAALLARAVGLEATLDLQREIRRPTYPLVARGEMSFERFVAANRWGFSRPIVKEPNLTLFYDELRRRFPQAQFAFVLRDPRDNLRSILNTLGIRGDLARLADEPIAPDHPRNTPGWRLVLDGRGLGIPGDHYIEQLAERWCRCADVYLEHSQVLALCRYEDFMADKLACLRTLAGALGLAVVNDVSDQLDTPFQPPGDRGVSWRGFFGRENLARIERVCGDRMAKLGYDV